MQIFGFEIRRARKPETRFLGELVKIDLSPGDVCILMAHQPIRQEEAESMRQAWRAAVGDDVTLLVLGNDLRLGVLSPPRAAEVRERFGVENAVAMAVVS